MSVTEMAAGAADVEALSSVKVIDADQHVDPPFTFWKDYLPAHLRHMAPVTEEGDEHDWVVFEGRRRPVFLLGALAGRASTDFKNKGKVSELRDASTAAARLKEMDEDGIDAAVLFGGGPLGTTNSELYVESFRAYNRWLADFCNDAPTRLKGVAYLPMRDVGETLGLLREAVKLGLRSVNIPAYPQAKDDVGQAAALTGDQNSTRAYWHAEFDPLWKEIVDNDIAVTFHLGGRTNRFGSAEHFLPDHVMTKVAMAEPVAIGIYGGLFDRFPGLRWGIIESGVGWMAWMAEYMENSWGKHRHWVGNTNKHNPSYYMDQNIWGSFLRDRIGIELRHKPGGRNIMWSSDFPHSETTYPNSRAIIAKDFAGIPIADVREIVGGRAARFFHFD